jgi:hypothetical protein
MNRHYSLHNEPNVMRISGWLEGGAKRRR